MPVWRLRNRSLPADNGHDMNTKLITALRLTATALEEGTFAYNWDRLGSCNCGSLFCALSGRSANELYNVASARRLRSGPNDGTGTWSQLAGSYCPITGKTTDALFKELLGYGLTVKSIVDLEYLRDPAVLARLIPPRKLDYKSARDAAAYMRAWADLLVEQERAKDDPRAWADALAPACPPVPPRPGLLSRLGWTRP